MLVRNKHHVFGSCGSTIQLAHMNAVLTMTPEGVIDPEKAVKLDKKKPMPPAGQIAKELCKMGSYELLNESTVKPKPPAPATTPATSDVPPATSPPVGEPPAYDDGPDNGEGDLPETPQTGDIETLSAILEVKNITELTVGEVEAALDTGDVPVAKVQHWLRLEKGRKKSARATMVKVLTKHLKAVNEE